MAPRALPLVVTFALACGMMRLLLQQQGIEVTLATSTTLETTDILRNLRSKLAQAEQRATLAEVKLHSQEQIMRKNASPTAMHATNTATPAERLYIHNMDSLPAKHGDLMMMTYATGGVREMLYNWVRHVQRLNLPLLVAAMDHAVVEQCSAQHFDCLDWSHTATSADKTYVRGSFDGFRALGVRKLDALLPVLKSGVHVVLSDVDCVWSSSPLPMFHGQIAGFGDPLHIITPPCIHVVSATQRKC